MYLRIRVALLTAFFIIAASALPVRADTERITASLAQASKLLEQGVPVQAIKAINQTMKSVRVPADLAAKAMLMRGQAQEQIGKYAYALADYNQALWMEGLSSADKTKAEEGRRRIMTKLGVADSSGRTQPEDGQTPPRISPVRKRQASPPKQDSSWGTQVQTSSAEKRQTGQSGASGGGIGNFFKDIFGTAESAAPAERGRPRATQTRAVQPVSRPVRTAQALQTATLSDADPAKASASGSDGSSERSGAFAVQFAALHTEDKAVYEADRVAKRYGKWLGGRTPSILIRPTSEGGTLYKVVVEPYERGEGIATCELLKTKGVSCMLISR